MGPGIRQRAAVALGGLLLSALLPALASATSRQPVLELVWKRELGTGNSRVAVADGRAVTLFSDGESDWLTALDAKTGREIWRYRIAATYLGHDGSRDGPHASPVISDGVIYGLGPRGHLVAVSLADGAERWKVDTVAEIAAVPPFWGFATTPVVVDDLVILQATGSHGSVWAFDKDTGELRWTAASDEVGYQSPAVLTLNGRRQLVVVTNRFLFGIEPMSGEVLWQYQHADQDRDGSSEPAPFDGSSFLLTASATENRSVGGLIRLTETEGRHEPEEVWRSRDLQGSYAIPIAERGRLYGLRNGILVCLDATTGKTLWRSRQPGARSLGRIGDHLLITGARGEVVLARFSEAGYEEVARTPVFERGGPAAPVVVEDMIFLRTHEAIAAVRVVEGSVATTSRPAQPSDSEPRGSMADLVASIEASPDPNGVISSFLEAQRGVPIVEAEGLVHFLYRGPATDVAIRGAMTDWGRADALARIEGTDLFFRSYDLSDEGRWEYLFHVDIEQLVTDPLNPSTAPGEWRPVSELTMPHWVEPTYFAAVDDPDPDLDGFELTSQILSNTRAVRVLLPPGYEAGALRYPLLVVLGGEEAIEAGDMARSLAKLMRVRDVRLVIAFVGDSKAPFRSWEDHGGPDDYREYGGQTTAEHGRMLAEELLPELRRRYRISGDHSEIGVYGIHNRGLAALHAASQHPEIFGAVAVQSMFFGPTPMQSSTFRRHPVFDEAITTLMAGGPRPQTIYIDWASHDLRDHEQGIDLARDNRDLSDRLTAAGFRVSGGEYPGGPGWRSWMARIDRILETLFAPVADEPAAKAPPATSDPSD